MVIISEAVAAAVLTCSAGVITPFLVLPGEPGAGNQLNLNLPGTNRLNGQKFVVRASGNLTVGAGTSTSAATPLQLVLYGSNTTSFAAASGNALYSNTAIAAFTYAAAVSVSVPWELEAEIVGDSTSAVLVGAGQGMQVNPGTTGTSIAIARAAVNQTPVSFTASAEPAMQFALALNGASSFNIPGGVTATLKSFYIEA